MTQFYFVRHGESEANAQRIPIDNGRSPLTEKGKKQSAFLAKRFRTIPVDVILASPYVRTKETAELFNAELQKPVEYVPTFEERRGPSAMDGLPKSDPRWEKLHTALKMHYHEPNWRYSDEENFEDFKSRGKKALVLLQARKEKTIVVITHGGFLRMLIALMLHGEELTSHEFIQVLLFFRTINTGITLCEYNEQNVNKGWRLITWMDHAHLGEI